LGPSEFFVLFYNYFYTYRHFDIIANVEMSVTILDLRLEVVIYNMLCFLVDSLPQKECDMTRDKDIVCYCPKCNQPKEPGYLLNRDFLQYAWERCELPYFTCGECRTVYIDKKFVQETISRWRKTTNARECITHKDAYYKAMVTLRERLEHFEEFGYIEVCFYKK
jgi:hypothetical protein